MNPEVKSALLAWCDQFETGEEIAEAISASPNAQYMVDPLTMAKYLFAMKTGAV